MRHSTRPILSPGRNDGSRDLRSTTTTTTATATTALTTSLSRRLHKNNSLRGTQSPALFPTKKNSKGTSTSFVENPEPSSPKVTCIGQVRVKTKKQGKKIKMRACGSKRVVHRRSLSETAVVTAVTPQDGGSGSGRNQRWVHLPFSICDSFKEFRCFLPCKSSCFSGSNGNINGDVNGNNGNDCGVLRWLVSMQEGEDGKRRDIELVVGGNDEEIRVKRECSRRRSIFDDMEFDDLFKNTNNNNDNDNNDVVVENDGDCNRVRVCVPPKNALLLMRCRSDPMKMVSLSRKFEEGLVEEGCGGDDDDGDVVEVEVEEGNRVRVEVNDTRESVKLNEVVDEEVDEVVKSNEEVEVIVKLNEVVEEEIVKTNEVLDEEIVKTNEVVDEDEEIDEAVDEDEEIVEMEETIVKVDEVIDEETVEGSVKLNEVVDEDEEIDEIVRLDEAIDEEIEEIHGELEVVEVNAEDLVVVFREELEEKLGVEAVEEVVEHQGIENREETEDKQDIEGVELKEKREETGEKQNIENEVEIDLIEDEYVANECLSEVVTVEEKVEQSEIEQDLVDNSEEVEQAMENVEETDFIEGENDVNECFIEAVTAEGVERHESVIDLVKLFENQAMEEVKEKKESNEVFTIPSNSCSSSEEEESKELHSKEDKDEVEIELVEEEQGRKSMEKQKNKPTLPDCLLLMMCEPKLSMEVSKETWISSSDFVRWLPERHHCKKDNKTDGIDHQCNKKTKAAAVAAQPPLPPASQVGKPGIQPGRSSISFPANLKLAKPGVGYEPCVLTRCKSAPMRSTAKFVQPELGCSMWGRENGRKLEPHRSATCGVGAAGVGF